MKKSTGYWLAFAAGVAAAGAVSYLLTSRKGQRFTKKFTERGEKIIDDAEDIITNAKDRFEDLRADLKKGFARSNGRKEEISGEIVM